MKVKSKTVIFLALCMTSLGADAEKCKSIEKCVSMAAEAAQAAKAALQVAIPSGAVMAFNLRECPNGWIPFEKGEARFIVGKGDGFEDVAKVGGSAFVELKPEMIPAHTHPTGKSRAILVQDHGGNHFIAPHDDRAIAPHFYSEQSTGQNNAAPSSRLPTVPPFVVLLMCQRI